MTQANVPGECWIKSKTACFYYWRKYEKSRETFIGDWTRTGDNLTFDEDGFFWFSGRNNDLFKVKGLWVSPIDIEAALTAHAAVREAAVVAYDDADGLTKPRAFIALRDGFSRTPALLDELRKAVAPLGSYKIPEDFVVIDALPRTTLQKIDRRALRERQTPRLGPSWKNASRFRRPASSSSASCTGRTICGPARTARRDHRAAWLRRHDGGRRRQQSGAVFLRHGLCRAAVRFPRLRSRARASAAASSASRRWRMRGTR